MHSDLWDFDYEIPEGYEVIPDEDYLIYGVDPGTVLIMVNKNYEIPHTISINRDDNFESIEEFNELIDINISNMKKMGMKIIDRKTENVDGKDYTVIKSTFKSLEFITIFTNLRDIMIASSVENIDNNYEDLLFVIKSIKEDQEWQIIN